jgi:hypothetical protein
MKYSGCKGTTLFKNMKETYICLEMEGQIGWFYWAAFGSVGIRDKIPSSNAEIRKNFERRKSRAPWLWILRTWKPCKWNNLKNECIQQYE